MLIDLHTHLIGPNDFTEPFYSDLDRCGIPREKWAYSEEDYLAGTAPADRVVVFGLRAQKTGWHADNRKVADFVRRFPKKYLFFTSIDPLDPDYLEQLEYDHRTLGCVGVKLGAIYQGLHPCSPAYQAIYRYCEANALPILVHMATTFSSGVPLDYARPIHMDRVACIFPRLKIVLAHLGHPWEAECIAAIRHQPNLYADLSALYYRPWQFYNAMRLVDEYGAGGKVFFGSDFPATTTADSVEGVRAVNRVIAGSGLPPVSDRLIEQIFANNPLTALAIEDARL